MLSAPTAPASRKDAQCPGEANSAHLVAQDKEFGRPVHAAHLQQGNESADTMIAEPTALPRSAAIQLRRSEKAGQKGYWQEG